MIIPPKLKPGDRVAIVSLSSGMLGEPENSHILTLGQKRLAEFGLEPVLMPNALKGRAYLKAHPEKRAEDLKAAFSDDSIQGIICAIGGDDTYRLLPYLMEDQAFVDQVRRTPKLFTGFSDTTTNHLMFYKLGLQTYYGPCLICDLGELSREMLPYTKNAFRGYLDGFEPIRPSSVWYQERRDFSSAALGTERVSHPETHGFELLQGSPVFEGELLGGCLESIYDILTSARYPDQGAVCQKYDLFPTNAMWQGKIMFLETCEEKPTPELLRRELMAIAQTGAFDVIRGILVGKPQDEVYYEAYKDVFREVISDPRISILYNVNFGHALPRTVLPYGAKVRVNADQQVIEFL